MKGALDRALRFPSREAAQAILVTASSAPPAKLGSEEESRYDGSVRGEIVSSPREDNARDLLLGEGYTLR